MIKSSEISKTLNSCVLDIIDLASILHQISIEYKETDMDKIENYLSYLDKETTATILTSKLDENLTELSLFFDSINQLKSRFDLIKTLYLTQFKSSKEISEDELNQFLSTAGLDGFNYPEEEDGELVDVDAPYPSMATFTNIPEDTYDIKNKKV